MMRIIKQVYLSCKMKKFKPTMPLSKPKKVKITTKDQIKKTRTYKAIKLALTPS